MTKGFTLLETLIYIALFTLVMGSGIIAAFYVIDSSEKNNQTINTQTEAQFLLKKISWMLAENDPGSLTHPYSITLASGIAQISENGGTPVPITSSAITISNFSLTSVSASPTDPAYTQVAFTANGKNYTTNIYASN
jgi:type II secretory pathway pseudopilin PulG